MQEAIEVFWSFRSPYSYLVTPDLLSLRADHDVSVVLRPVLPIALRAKQTVFDAADKKRLRAVVLCINRSPMSARSCNMRAVARWFTARQATARFLAPLPSKSPQTRAEIGPYSLA